MRSLSRQTNWIPLSDPISEEEIKIQLTWSADQHTTRAIERQSKLMGFASPTEYLRQAIAAVVAGNEESTLIAGNGKLLCGEFL
jgi:hypothetical protein